MCSPMSHKHCQHLLDVLTLLSALDVQHSSGLNCGRWDYIFSFIKTMRADPTYIMPDRCELPFMLHMGL